MASLDVKQLLVAELDLLAKNITSMVEEVRTSRKSYTLEQFLNVDTRKKNEEGGVERLGGLYQLFPVDCYEHCFRALGVKDREGLTALYKEHDADAEVRNAVEALLRSEKLFLDYVTEVDEEVKAAEDKLALATVLSVGSKVPSDLELLDADSNSLVSLGELLGRAPFTLFVFMRHYV